MKTEDYKLNPEEEIKRLRKEYPHMSEDKMREGIDVFNELLDLSKTCHEDIKRAVENTLKIGTNIGGDPVIFSAMISEMFLKEAVSFATSVQRSAVNQYTKERKKAILAHLGMND